MGRSTKAKRASRYDQLDENERAELVQGSSELVLTGKLRSYKGSSEVAPFFKKALSGFEEDVAKAPDAVALVDAFVLCCNDSAKTSKRAFEGLKSQLRAGLFALAEEAGYLDKPMLTWPVTIGQDLVDWLKRKKLSGNTARKYYGAACELLAQMAEEPRLRVLIPDFEPFPIKPFEGAHRETKVTQSLGLSVLVKTLIAARSDFLEVVDCVNHADKLFSGTRTCKVGAGESETYWYDLDEVLLWLKEQYPTGQFPSFTRIGEENIYVTRAISRFHGGWRKVSLYFRPTAEALIPPMLLFYIYSHMNTEPLRALKQSDVGLFKGLGGQRQRVFVHVSKLRGSAYDRTFPVDDADAASPSSILSFVKAWTSDIRKFAGRFSEALFIHPSLHNKIKTFKSSTIDGASKDSSWDHHLREFCERHRLPSFSVKELRQTAIDFAWLISDGDIRAILAVKGGTSAAVIRAHYKSDSQLLRENVTIAQLQSNREREAATSGKTNHRGSPRNADISAATPGWNCIDPYQSPILGEVPDRLCQALGMCPACAHGSPQLNSEYSLGRSLQLREQFKLAPLRLGLQRWKRYEPAAQALEKIWLPLFPHEVWEKAKFLNLAPIGELE